MTPAVASLFRRMAATRLAEIRTEAEQLEAALAELGGDGGDLVVSTNGVTNITSNGTAPHPDPPRQPPSAPSPLAARLDELRDVYGPVFVLDTTAEYGPDQIVTWGKAKQKVQIIEATAETPRRWFGKVLEE